MVLLAVIIIIIIIMPQTLPFYSQVDIEHLCYHVCFILVCLVAHLLLGTWSARWERRREHFPKTDSIDKWIEQSFN